MKLNYFGPKPYLDFVENGTILSYGDDMFDCAEAQKDEQVVIDICLQADGRWQYNVDHNAKRYVANIIIPAKQYNEQIVLDDQGQPVLNEDGTEEIERIPIALNMNQVIGNLWTLQEQNSNEEEI